MRVIKPYVADPGGRSASGVSRRTPLKKPQWLKEYIDDQPIFCLLSCGHKENLNDRALLIIHRIAGTYVVCQQCQDLAAVVRRMTIREYAELPPPIQSDAPLF